MNNISPMRLCNGGFVHTRDVIVADYSQTDAWFKVRKAARYVRLFGLSRTLAKIGAQKHMKSPTGFTGDRWENPACKDRESQQRTIAVIGCGNFAYSTIAYYIAKDGRQFLRCAYDIDRNKSLSLVKAYQGAYAVSDWRQILMDPNVRVVFVSSNHASHAEYGIACIKAGKHVHIEKPHVVTKDQLDRLASAMHENPQSKVFLGFNRPKSPLFMQLLKYLSRESGPIMINWFIAGHELPDDHWYFDEKEGGRVLGNLCHWTDLTLHLVTLELAFPCTIIPATPAGAKSDFVVSVIFADRSCAAITFSAKGHTFEGVRELLNVHKGRVIASLGDFQTLTIDIVEKKMMMRLRHRDHGHEANIIHSLRGVCDDAIGGEQARYVIATANFFLAIRDAIDSGKTIILSREDIKGATS